MKKIKRPPVNTVTVDYTPTNKQKIAHSATERYILYGGAVGGGKTKWLAAEALAQSLYYSGNAGFLCRERLTDLRSTTLETLLKTIPPQLIRIHHQTDRYIKIVNPPNDSTIYYGGLGDDDITKQRLGGLELGWFAFDQAEEGTETQFNLLTTRLRLNIPGIHYHGFLTANPQPGWLRDRFIDRQLPDHRFIPALPRDNPHLPKEYEENLRRTLPEGMVRQLLEGNWDIDMAANYLIPYSHIRAAINKELEIKGDKIAGVDIAREGDDETVFILRQGNKVLYIEAWSHQDLTFTAGKISRLIREKKPEITNIDSIGIGAGVFDPLNNEGFPVKAINVGEKALDREIYVNRRAEYFNLLAKKFRDGEISIPDDPKLTSQLASLKYHYQGTRLLMESKEVMKRKGYKSPDYADALMLAFIPYEVSGLEMSPTKDRIPVTHWG